MCSSAPSATARTSLQAGGASSVADTGTNSSVSGRVATTAREPSPASLLGSWSETPGSTRTFAVMRPAPTVIGSSASSWIVLTPGRSTTSRSNVFSTRPSSSS
jgi:hypothetical protein